VLAAKDAVMLLATRPNCGKPVKAYKRNCEFNKKYNQFLGYQAVNESLQWLRMELRYGKNPPHEDVQTSEIGNPQPSSCVQHDKDMEKVQRLNGGGSECTNHTQ
jgi:hypothetical protein